jgi:predicted nucleic acid-binding protein
MKGVFVDTSFFVAFLNPDDENYAVATEYMAEFEGPLVTTLLIFVELGNFLSKMRQRRRLAPLIRDLRRDDRFEILPADESLFDTGLMEYAARADKHWYFTDCTSFVVMRRRKLKEALTSDHHFEQAGFVALLK